MTIVSIPAGAPFLETLAGALIDSETLQDDTVLVPTHRAGRALVEAFAAVAGGRTLLLPRILSLGELDPDEIAVLTEAEPGLADDPGLKPGMSPLRRRLLLATLVMKRDPEIPPDRAMQLAGALARLIDEVQFNRLDFDRLDTLVREEFAAHWQQTLDFLSIVTEAWPAILEDEGRLDPIDRRNRLYAAQITLWRKHPPAGRITAAGSTGIMPATADLLACIAAMPGGRVVLPGIDRHLNDHAWDALGKGHPQWALKQLLERLGATRDSVPDWPEARPSPRSRLVAEAMRPAATTEAWCALPPALVEGAQGLATARFANPAAEAGAIALMLRESAEHGKSAALVTPDRDLARRVSVELGRWNLTADDSAGVPLGRTPVGAFLRLVAHAAAEDFAPALLLAALKHPLAACGMERARFRSAVRQLERSLLRGPRPGNGLDGLLKAARDRKDARIAATTDRIVRCFEPLAAAQRRQRAALADLLAAHVETAERLAHDNERSGIDRLWRGEEGQQAAALLAEFDAAAPVHPDIAPSGYAALFDETIGGLTVRPVRPHHPGLAILGPLEARLQRADRLILAGLNQGAWPADPAPDPWMSRQMREQFGLPPAETRQGLAAHDFAQALHSDEVILTRSERVGTDPTVPSPWLQRLETVLQALGRGIEDRRWAAWQAALDKPEPAAPARPPWPCPPVAARPRTLSATQIETWLTDPYSIYARHILGLRPLDPIDADPGPRERGSAIHAALERFAREYPGPDLPEEALARLLALGQASLAQFGNRPLEALFWTRRFNHAAEVVIGTEQKRRRDMERILTETQGKAVLDCPGGPFTLTALADRLEIRQGGGLVIVDYKTGAPPSNTKVAQGAARQLPVEAVIAEAGGFPECRAGTVEALEYWRISGGKDDRCILVANMAAKPNAARGPRNAAVLIEATREGIRRYAEAFYEAGMPYLAEPRPEFPSVFNDYRHLSRKDEWSRTL